ncbi:DUF3887 domain-containing protein [Curtobacterium sp. 22159]|uniref:DUF3887 domain-containing protein n=1 Tax=Curtobacterium sp. 22159 TaxID=3453882 RepID=UPI003F83701A
MTDEVYELASRLYRSVGEIIASPVLQEADQPLDRIVAVQALGEQTTAMLAAAVAEARRAGVTWQQVGAALGISRQAAFQRFNRSTPAPSIGEELVTDAESIAIDRASSVIDDLTSGSWDAVVDRFDDAMRARLQADGLSAAWSQVVASVGAFDHREETVVTRASGYTITTTPLVFATDACTARISFRDDGRITGLFILAGSPS